MHLDEELIQRSLHDELGAAAPEARRHLDRCAACRDRLTEARAEEERVFALLRHADHPVPAVDPRTLLAPAERRGGRWARRAAAALAGAAIAGAAYAAPGSPVPAALARLLGLGAPTAAPAPQATAGVSSDAAGIAIAPGETLVIQLEAQGEKGMASIALTGEDEVVVRAVAGSATFTSDPGRLLVRSTGAARLEIFLPRDAPSVDVLLGTAPVFRLRDGAAMTAAPRDLTGRYFVPLRAAPP
jgi:hypothetical protein